MTNGTTGTIITQGVVPLLALGVLSETIRVTQGRKPRRRSKRSFNWLGF